MGENLDSLVHVRELAKRGEIAPLIDLTHSESTEVASAAVRQLGRLRAAAATPRLLVLLDHDDLPLRRATARAVGEIADQRASEALLQTLRAETDGATRWQAAAGLGRIGDSRALPLLVDALADREIRDAAVTALGRLGDPAALPPLRDLSIPRWRHYLRTLRRRAIDEIAMHCAERDGRVRQPLVKATTDLWAAGAAAAVASTAPVAFAIAALEARALPLIILAGSKGVVLTVWSQHVRRRPRRAARWLQKATTRREVPELERAPRTWGRRWRSMGLVLLVDLLLVWLLSHLTGPELAGALLAGGFGWLYSWRDAATLQTRKHDEGQLVREHDSRPEDEHRTFLVNPALTTP